MKLVTGNSNRALAEAVDRLDPDQRRSLGHGFGILGGACAVRQAAAW